MRGMLIGETALLPEMRSSPLLLLRNHSVTGSSCAPTRLRDQCSEAICRKQTSSLDSGDYSVTTESVEAADVNPRKHRSAVWRSAVPNLGVTCPQFFRCGAPRFFTVRRIQAPEPPTYGSLRGPAMRAETDSGSTASAPSGIGK